MYVRNPLLYTQKHSDPSGIRPLLEAGLEHLRLRDWAAAVDRLQETLQLDPACMAAIRGLATAHLLSGDEASARRVLKEFTLDNPMSGEGWRLAALLEWKLGDRAAAMEVLRGGLRRLPHAPSLHRQMAIFLGAGRSLSEAADHAGEAARDTRDHSSVLPIGEYLSAALGSPKHVGRMLELTMPPESRRESVNDDWLDRLVANPVMLDALLGAFSGVDSSIAGEGPDRQMLLEVEWKLSRLCELQPNHADRQLALAKVQYRLGTHAAAMLSLQRAVRANPRLIEAHRLRARLQVEVGDIPAAIDTLKSLIGRKLAWPDIHYEIAALEQQVGHAADAEKHLKTALRLNPSYVAARQLLDYCATAQAA